MSAISQDNEFPLRDIMNVGSNLEILCSVTSKTRIRPSRPNQFGVADRLRMLQTDLENLELSQSEGVLKTKVDELLKRIEDDSRPHYLGSDAKCIRQIARLVKKSLIEEGNQRKTFVTLRDREGRIENLLSDSVLFFGIPPGDILELTPICIEDFYESAKCYSVGFAAASIMFMLRATEEVLRSYYARVTGQEAGDGNWGALLRVLSSPDLGCPSALTDLLDKLRMKRNAAMHPQRREPDKWDIRTANEVLEQCRCAIQMMVDDLNTRRDAAM